MINTVKIIIDLFFFRILSRGAGFLTLLLYLKFFSTKEFAFYGLIITTVYTIISFGSLGLKHSFGYLIGNGNRSKALFYTILIISIILSTISFLFLIKIFIFNDLPFTVTYLSSLFGFILLIFTIIQGGFLGFEDINSYKYSEFLLKILILFLSSLIILLFDKITLELACYILIISTSITLLYSIIKLSFIYKKRSNQIKYSPFIISKEVLAFGFPICMISGISLLNPLICLYVAESFLTVSLVATLFFCIKITEIIIESAKSTTSIIFSKGVNVKSERYLLFLTGRVSWWLIFLTISCSLFSLIFLPFLSSLIAFKTFNANIFLILTLGLPFISFSKTISSAFLSRRYQYTCVFGFSLGVLTNILILSINKNVNIELIVISMVASQIVTCIFFLIAFCKQLNIPIHIFLKLGIREFKLIISIITNFILLKKSKTFTK